MAVISNLSVESITSADNELFWTNPNLAQTQDVHRSTDNFISNDETLITGIAANVTGYSDLSAIGGTRYWYKVVQVAGGSNIADVVTQVCFVLGSQPQPTVTMPQMSEPLSTEQVNQLVDSLNQTLGGTNNPGTPCTVCSTFGSLILDCTACNNFIVEMSEDINSISMLGCSGTGQIGSVCFTVPPNQSHNICGFLVSLGFDGAECADGSLTVNGGADGTTVCISFTKSPNGPIASLDNNTSGGGGGNSKKGKPLKISCQTGKGSKNTTCSIDCAGDTTTPGEMKIVVTGGFPPYTLTTTGELVIDNIKRIVSVPANTGPGTAGNAYVSRGSHGAYGVGPLGGSLDVGSRAVNGLCDNSGGAFIGGEAQDLVVHCLEDITWSLITYPLITDDVNYIDTIPCDPAPVCSTGNPIICILNTLPVSVSVAAQKTDLIKLGAVTDIRTQQMKDDGCKPCTVEAANQVITATDSAGTAVSVTISQ